MQMTCKLTAVLLGVVALVSAAMTHAQLPPGPHFTFTVPLRLANLPPEILRHGVFCSVMAEPGSGIMASGETVQRGVFISGGAVNTEVVVNVTVTDPLRDPARAITYLCKVELYGTNPTGGPSVVYLDDSNTRFPLAPGAPFKRETRVPIPR